MEDGGALCTGKGDQENRNTEFLDIYNLGSEYNVFNVVYVLAYSLDDMLRYKTGRGPFTQHSCATLQTLEPREV